MSVLEGHEAVGDVPHQKTEPGGSNFGHISLGISVTPLKLISAGIPFIFEGFFEIESF